MAPPTKRPFRDLSKEELIEELERHQQIIVELKKKAKTSNSSTSTQKSIDPDKLAERVSKIKKLAAQQIKKQMKWKPSCKYGTPRWSWSTFVDENVFRALRGLKEGEKTKGTKLSPDAFEEMVGTELCTSIRYGGQLTLKGENVNITYNSKEGQMRISGGYGLDV